MELIREYALQLKLANIKDNYHKMISEAQLSDLSYEDFLKNILKEEVELREKNRISTLIKYAKFPYKVYLEDYQLEHLNSTVSKQVKKIRSLEFIENKENILLIFKERY